MRLWECLTTKKPSAHSRGTGCFICSSPKASLDLSQIKSPAVSRQGFFGVDKRFEISNPDLIRDIVDIIETLEEFS